MDSTPENIWSDAEVISRYTRAQAIEDGVLVDLTEWARETGFKFPMAVTTGVWSEVIQVTPAQERKGKSVRGRAHDVLWMAFLAIRGGEPGRDTIYFQVKSGGRWHQLKVNCGPGDNAEPVLTIMLLNED